MSQEGVLDATAHRFGDHYILERVPQRAYAVRTQPD